MATSKLSILCLTVVALSFMFAGVNAQTNTTTTDNSTTSTAASASTNPVIYGLDFLGWGFDATYRDPFFALKPEMFVFTFNDTNPITYQYPTGDTIWDVPNEVFVRTVAKTTTNSYLFTDSRQKLLTLDAKLNIQASETQMDIAADIDVNWVNDQTENLRITSNFAETSLYQLYIAEKNPSPEFMRDLSKLSLTYSLDPTSYNLFLQRYGTHYVDSVIVGGSIQQDTTIDISNNSDVISLAVAVNAKFNQAAGGTVTVGLNVNFQQAQEEVTTTTTSDSIIYGGDPSFTDFVLSAGDPDSAKLLFESWKSSLVTNPVTIRYRLVELWTLVNDINVRAELCKAIGTYTGFLPKQDPNYCSQTNVFISGSIQGGLQ